MDFEVIAWTTFFFGGDILILALLLTKAVQADRKAAREGNREQDA